jgi:hypothetical protein
VCAHGVKAAIDKLAVPDDLREHVVASGVRLVALTTGPLRSYTRR